MIAHTNTRTALGHTPSQSPFTRDHPEEGLLLSPIPEACINWTSVTVPNSTAFDPSGSSKLSYHASTSVTCDDPGNAHFRFSLYLTGSSSPDDMKDPKQSQTYLAYTGTTDLSNHQVAALEFPFPSIFNSPTSSELNVSHVYQVTVVDKDNSTLTQSSLFYLEPGAYNAPAPSMPDSSGPSNRLSGAASAGLAVGLVLVVVLLMLCGWKLRHFLHQRSALKKKKNIKASIRHLGPQDPAVGGLEMQRMGGGGGGRAAAATQPQACGPYQGELLRRRSPPSHIVSSSPPEYAAYTPTPTCPPVYGQRAQGHSYASPPQPPRPSSSRYDLDDTQSLYGSPV